MKMRCLYVLRYVSKRQIKPFLQCDNLTKKNGVCQLRFNHRIIEFITIPNDIN